MNSNPGDVLVVEGLLTTLNSDGSVNLSPMGPRISEGNNRMLLRPYKTSRSFVNLLQSKRGVFHVTDDVNLIARAAVGPITPQPEMVTVGDGRTYRLVDTCRWYLLELNAVAESDERAELDMKIIDTGRIRDFIGFNRAKHAVIEAAILASRVNILPGDDILKQMKTLHSWVEKTGGPEEYDAYEFLLRYIHAKLSSE